MSFRLPPRAATWLLQHLGPRYRNESLAGDLCEQYQLNRTRAWYWREVIIAVGLGSATAIQHILTGRSRQHVRGTRRGASIKRLMRVFAVTAISAGTLAWANGTSRVSERCTAQSGSAIAAAFCSAWIHVIRH